MVGVKGRSGSGGRRPGAGRPRRESLVWPQEFDLRTRENWASFLRHLVKVVYEHKLSERIAGCVNNTMRLLGDAEGWVTKVPVQITQAQVTPAPGMVTEKEVQGLLEGLPLEQQLEVWKKFKERRGLRPNMASGSSG